ncbi:unnamed protein product [Allacma fusca]|uniref:Protein naked cuticle homolog n=1 Tax=Allacma fusca TaxID=39272 RepID=A0A8J2JY47_9HEXA|nr:unnamed protein product [Allacma fusca]
MHWYRLFRGKLRALGLKACFHIKDSESDIPVEGSESGEERREFSFTFYELDGHGKITEDDIAALVRSIYGAVNESITVPHGGKKTIKVRLTLTPEDPSSDCNGEENVSQNNNNNNNNNNLLGNSNHIPGSPAHPNKLGNNVNVTIEENLDRDRQPEVKKHVEKPKFSSVRLPNHFRCCRGCRNRSPEVLQDCSASPLRNRKKLRERACSLQRPDLFELLQANMEKNHVNPCCRLPHPNSHPQCSHNHLIDPSCPVLPLLNSSPSYNNDDNLCSSGKSKLQHEHHHVTCSPRTKICEFSSQQHPKNPGGGNHNHHCNKKHGHHRSRSHDLSQNMFKYHLLCDRDQVNLKTQAQNATSQCNNNHSCTNNYQLNCNQETLDILSGCIFQKNSNVANNSSPHQLKHRNREQEHARAMAQVISWLERENIGMEKKFSSPKKMPNPFPSTPPVKRHEHHHVHEHIHHHYHRYAKETSIIV